jgi:hypothetical protein
MDIRMPSTALLGVSSADRYKNIQNVGTAAVGRTDPYSFSLRSNQNYLAGYFTRIALTEFQMNWTLPTITVNNCKIRLKYAGVDYIINIPNRGLLVVGLPESSGWYTPTSLATMLQAAIRLATGNAAFTVTSDATGAFTAQSNNGAIFAFSPFVDNTRPEAFGLWNMMGWYGNGLPIAAKHEGGIPTMLRTQFVDVVCSQLTYAQDVKDADTGNQSKDVLARIYLSNPGITSDPELVGSAPFGIYRDFSTPKQIKWERNLPIGQMTFSLYDDQGYELNAGTDFTSGEAGINGDWNITLLVSEV